VLFEEPISSVHHPFNLHSRRVRSVPAMGTGGEHTPSVEAGPGVIHGYDLDAVERYLEAIDAECRRLEAQIADTRERIARASYAIDAKRVLLSMLVQACQDITAKHRQAELVMTRFAHHVATRASVSDEVPGVLDLVPPAVPIRWDGGAAAPSAPEIAVDLVTAP
jgi:hypothetical protein